MLGLVIAAVLGSPAERKVRRRRKLTHSPFKKLSRGVYSAHDTFFSTAAEFFYLFSPRGFFLAKKGKNGKIFTELLILSPFLHIL